MFIYFRGILIKQYFFTLSVVIIEFVEQFSHTFEGKAWSNLG